ncbi:MAG TPA: hypothetical protein VGI50_19040 [Solirubrobacteraceae bacterium]
MAKPRSDQGPALIGLPPEEVRVTVTVLPRRRRTWIRRRLGHVPARANRRLAISLLVVSVAVVASGLAAFLGGVGTTAASEHGHQGQPGAFASAARCRGALAALDRRRGYFERAVWCERYAGRGSASPYQFVGGPLPAFHVSGR